MINIPHMIFGFLIYGLYYFIMAIKIYTNSYPLTKKTIA